MGGMLGSTFYPGAAVTKHITKQCKKAITSAYFRGAGLKLRGSIELVAVYLAVYFKIKIFNPL